MIDTEGVAKLFKDHVFPFVGLPKKIISDRDPHFTSAFFKELCKQLEVSQNLSTAYHPQMDGQSEKTNQHVETALRIYCNYQQNDWAHWLPIVQYAINARPSATMKQAPYELWMGFIPRAHQADHSSKVPTIELHREQIKEARKQALEAMKRAQELLGCKSTHRPYQKGQKVWLEGTNLHTTHPTVKLHPKHYGPFKVIEAIGPTTYHLELLAEWKIHNTFHGSLLLPYHETKEHGRNFLEPAPDLIKGQPEWEVEEVLDSRRYRRKLQYLIKWKGYSDAHNSWEPEEDVNAPVLLTAFYGQNPGAIRKLEKENTDCGQRTLSLDQRECTRRPGTQPRTIKPPLTYIRSARTVNKGPNMSGGHTPANPSPSSSQSTQGDHRAPLTLSQAVNNLVQSARQQRRRLQQESTFADIVESLSPSATQMGSSLASNITSLGRATASGSTNQSWIPSASSAASTSTRRTDTRRLSGHILSTLLR